MIWYYLLVFLTSYSILNVQARQTCSWEVCNRWSNEEGVINVHLVPHTHDDLGWIKTVDQYYYGAKPSLVPVGVQYIFNTVIDELQKHPDRRFSFAETGFLWRWYNDHSDFHKHSLQKLVKTGQIEMIGGGWVQNDEACSHYVDIIDQMTLGLKKLEQVFGECGKPRTAWQIDPFGHSKEQANLLALMGFTSVFFARIHYLEKEARLKNKSLEFVWNTSEDLKTQILAGAFFQDGYGPPEGFCFDTLCRDDPIMDNPDLEGYNLDEKISSFVSHVKKQASFLRSSHVMMLMGSDFQYTNANAWYTNLDKLIQHVNGNAIHGVHVFYSTPSCYVKGLTESSTTRLPTKEDDFFPYASSNVSYWTGYFTSRPTFKRMVRETSSLLQLCKQLDALADLGPEDDADVETIARAAALVQHHDAVTGTAKEKVTGDYKKRLAKATKEGEIVINDYLKKVYPKADAEPPRHYICPLINETRCHAIENESTFALTVFNSNSRQMSGVVSIPYYSKQAMVKNAAGDRVPVQLMKVFRVDSLNSIYRAPYELLVPIQVGPVGYATYIVDNSTSKRAITPLFASKIVKEELVTIENEDISLLFDENGLVSSLTEKATNRTYPFRQQFFYYKGVMNGAQPSGAYVFRPDGDAIKVDKAQLEVIKGDLVQEVRQTFNPWIAQVIRLKKGTKPIEFDWIIGPIPKEEKNPVTKEVVTQYITDIKNANVFFTDSNGRQMMKRQKNFNPSFKYVDSEPVSGNYYPVTNRAFIKDEKRQLTVLTDRAEGATVLDGGLEIMLHRRCFADDHWGVEEALDEPGYGSGLVARGTHYVLLGETKTAAAIHRPLAVDIFHSPQLTFAPVKNATDYAQRYRMKFSALRRSLPPFVHLMTLERWHRRSLLLRLEHIFQNQEDFDNSKPMSVVLDDLFTQFKVVNITEVTLAGNRNASRKFFPERPNRTSSNFTVVLEPSEIRTFVIGVQWN
uniref:Alpha-mannosidase n=1 Tax=Haemonchus contortus TaxID=6289 RepID=A0A7I4YMU9_HAECO